MITTLATRVLAVSAALLFAGAGVVQASALSATYYTMSTSHPDANLSINGVVQGLVESALGPDGLPVVSALSHTLTGSGHLNDTNAAGELLWWTPHATVTQSFYYPAMVAVPFNISSNFFPNGASSDGGNIGFLSAHLQGTFSTPAGGTITMSLGADDDAWVFIDGILAMDLGGVHALSSAPVTSAPLLAGSHTLDLFFADRHVVQSGLVFSADLLFMPPRVPEPAAVPEPATLALLGLGLVGLAASRRRKLN
jgi:fibro-slime domain-containing protein